MNAEGLISPFFRPKYMNMFSLRELSKHVNPIDKPQPKAKWEKKSLHQKEKNSKCYSHNRKQISTAIKQLKTCLTKA